LINWVNFPNRILGLNNFKFFENFFLKNFDNISTNIMEFDVTFGWIVTCLRDFDRGLFRNTIERYYRVNGTLFN